MAMAVLQWKSADAQVWLADLYPRGPFWPMWGTVFRGSKPPMQAWDIAQTYGKKNVCFKKFAVGIYGPAAPIVLNQYKTACHGTALLRSYSDFVIRGLGLQGLTKYASPPSKKVVVTWMSRLSSTPWPEAKFCMPKGTAKAAGGGASVAEADVGSFFTCDFFQHLGTRPLQRIVRNDAEARRKMVIMALKALERENFANGAQVEVRPVDYNLLPFKKQIEIDLQTDVMVGPHGAGLLHSLFMADRGTLIELMIDGTAARLHFSNLASWYGRRYFSMTPPNPVPVTQIVGAVRDAIARMDLSRH
ncbi:unnamed protein product [Phaeothamnion confervicola]